HPLARGCYRGDLRNAGDCATLVGYRGDRQGEMDESAVFGLSNRLETVHLCSFPRAGDDPLLFLHAVRWQQQGDWFPDDLLGCISVEPFRRVVPAGHNAV